MIILFFEKIFTEVWDFSYELINVRKVCRDKNAAKENRREEMFFFGYLAWDIWEKARARRQVRKRGTAFESRVERFFRARSVSFA